MASAIADEEERILYRGMRMADDGRPLVGPTARTLGVRAEIDVLVTTDGRVHPGAGGLSVSPDDPHHLPPHRRPPEFGGTGNDPVWHILVPTLGLGLVYRPDPDNPARHGLVEPATSMPLEDYQGLLAQTRDSWRLTSQRSGGRGIREDAASFEGGIAMRTELAIEAQWDKAMQGERPALRLRAVIQSLLVQGWTRDELLASLEQFRNALRTADREADEDAVLEAMDFLVGWCSPQMKV